MTNKDAQKIIFAFCDYSNAVDKLHLGDKQRKLVDKLAKADNRNRSNYITMLIAQAIQRAGGEQ